MAKVPSGFPASVASHRSSQERSASSSVPPSTWRTGRLRAARDGPQEDPRPGTQEDASVGGEAEEAAIPADVLPSRLAGPGREDHPLARVEGLPREDGAVRAQAGALRDRVRGEPRRRRLFPARQVPHAQLQPLLVRPAGRGRVRDAGAGPVEAEEHLPGGVAGQLLRSRGAGGPGIERPELRDAGPPRQHDVAVLRDRGEVRDAEPRGERLRRSRDSEVRADADAVEIDAFHGRALREEQVRLEPGTRRLHPSPAQRLRGPGRHRGSPRNRCHPPVPFPRRFQSPALEEDVAAVWRPDRPGAAREVRYPEVRLERPGRAPACRNEEHRHQARRGVAHVLREGDERAVRRVAREPAAVGELLRGAAERRHDVEAAAPGLGAIHHGRAVGRQGGLPVVGGVARQACRVPPVGVLDPDVDGAVGAAVRGVRDELPVGRDRGIAGQTGVEGEPGQLEGTRRRVPGKASVEPDPRRRREDERRGGRRPPPRPGTFASPPR